MNSFFDTADNVLGLVILAAIPAYLLLQVWTAVELSRAWRMAALAPLALAVTLIVWSLAALTGNAGFWPLPLVVFAPAAAIYLAVVMALRAATAHTRRPAN